MNRKFNLFLLIVVFLLAASLDAKAQFKTNGSVIVKTETAAGLQTWRADGCIVTRVLNKDGLGQYFSSCVGQPKYIPTPPECSTVKTGHWDFYVVFDGLTVKDGYGCKLECEIRTLTLDQFTFYCPAITRK